MVEHTTPKIECADNEKREDYDNTDDRTHWRFLRWRKEMVFRVKLRL